MDHSGIRVILVSDSSGSAFGPAELATIGFRPGRQTRRTRVLFLGALFRVACRPGSARLVDRFCWATFLSHAASSHSAFWCGNLLQSFAFAAQKSLATIIGGLQIAISQPMKIGDVLIVEEGGRIGRLLRHVLRETLL